MYLAGKLSKFEVKDWNGRQMQHLRWWDMFVEDVTMDLLEGENSRKIYFTKFKDASRIHSQPKVQYDQNLVYFTLLRF